MSELKRTLLLATLAVLGLAYWLNAPVPHEFSSTVGFIIRREHAMWRFQFMAMWIAEQMGLGNQIALMRSLRETELPKSTLSHQDIQVEDVLFDSVPVRVYRSRAEATDQRSGIVYYHGGGWAMGTVDACHGFVMMLAKRTNAVVVSVDYRLAPEHVYPAAHDDCVTATEHFLQRAAEYGVDPSRVAIAGDSAGGNLAATVALSLRDNNFEPKPKLQVLIYPVTQAFDFHLPSMISNSHGPLLARRDWVEFPCIYVTGNSSYYSTFRDNQHISPVARQRLAEYVDIGRLPGKYLTNYKRPAYEQSADEHLWNEIKENVLHRYLSPLAAPDLSKLPQAYVMTSEFDILRDEGILYAIRLKDAGNVVTHVNWEEAFHGIMTFGQDWPEVQKMIDHMINYINENL